MAEAFDINQKFALLAIDDDDRKGNASMAVQELGYRVHIAQSADDGRDRLRKTNYDLVIIDQGFQGGTLLDNPLLQLLQGMPMTARRYMLIALLTPDMKTLDNMSAFSASVNVVVNYNDSAQINPILERALAENDQFFRVIRTVMQEAGKR